MKKIIVLLLFLAHCTFLSAQSIEKYRILLTGASFASEPNTWFEMGCEALAARPVNRAIGGEAIANTANRMADGTLYSAEELEHIDAFVIMQVHEQDVYDESQLKENYEDYTLPFDKSNYAAAFDYVIKRYISECYKLKDKPGSRYYGTPYGKPAIIVLSTHWHDAREIYNSSVRRLAAKWGLPVIEFDKNIGFSKNTLHPVTKEQYSLIFSRDKQRIAGTVYGWHPERGRDAYIQQRMAAIFADKMRGILPLR